MSSEEKQKKSNDLPLGPTMLIIFILILFGLALLAWGLYNRKQLDTHTISDVTSPACFTTSCPSGTNLTPFQLDPSANPDTATYETVNYCTTNAPPTSFVQALELCAGTIDASELPSGFPTIDSTQVTNFAAFYNQQYINTCGFGWKTEPANSSDIANVQTDPVSVALVGCANQLGITNNSDIQNIQSICGSACSGSS